MMKRKIALLVVAFLMLSLMVLFTSCAPKVESIELSETQIELKPGESKLVTYNISPIKASDTEVSWSSSNESVATVNNAGEIVAKAEGNCKITIKAGDKTDSVDVNVILTPEMLMAEGKYKEAYEKADATKKDDIADANLVAYISQMCVDSLKDSKSFELRDAWVNHGEDNTHQIVLKVAANNSYGNTVINYWLYTYDKEEQEYKLWDAFSDLDEEDYYSWQDYDEQLEILLNNAIKERIKEIMADSNLKLSSEYVDNVNSLFENGILKDVRLIEINK